MKKSPHQTAIAAVLAAGWNNTTVAWLTKAREESDAPGSYMLMLRAMPHNDQQGIKDAVRLYVDVYTRICAR